MSAGSWEHRVRVGHADPCAYSPVAIPSSVSWEQRCSHLDSRMRGKRQGFWPFCALWPEDGPPWPRQPRDVPPDPELSGRASCVHPGSVGLCREGVGSVAPLTWALRTVGMPGGSYSASPLRPRAPLLPVGGRRWVEDMGRLGPARRAVVGSGLSAGLGPWGWPAWGCGSRSEPPSAGPGSAVRVEELELPVPKTSLQEGQRGPEPGRAAWTSGPSLQVGGGLAPPALMLWGRDLALLGRLPWPEDQGSEGADGRCLAPASSSSRLNCAPKGRQAGWGPPVCPTAQAPGRVPAGPSGCC